MGIVFLHGNGGSGGGGGLNFKVVGNPQPTSPSENTIWLNTDAPITGYEFSATEPANPVEGMAWIAVGSTSTVAFNVIKKNSIMVYPISAKQYVSGVWVTVTAQSYQNGAWESWLRYLYYYGDENAAIVTWTNEARKMANTSIQAKTLTVTKKSNGGIKLTTNGSGTGTYRTTEKVDLTDMKTVKLVGKLYGNNSGNDKWACFGIWSNMPSYYGESLSAYVGSKQTTVTNPSIDVSKLTGEFYIGFGLYDTGSSSYAEIDYLQLL